mmetsp:Transcript_724/g.1745  ORF Transcript_724/g.1745 Transcript_724/m.1745 type:complete len:229 (+) Transcript_724:146-832(+)
MIGMQHVQRQATTQQRNNTTEVYDEVSFRYRMCHTRGGALLSSRRENHHIFRPSCRAENDPNCRGGRDVPLRRRMDRGRSPSHAGRSWRHGGGTDRRRKEPRRGVRRDQVRRRFDRPRPAPRPPVGRVLCLARRGRPGRPRRGVLEPPVPGPADGRSRGKIGRAGYRNPTSRGRKRAQPRGTVRVGLPHRRGAEGSYRRVDAPGIGAHQFPLPDHGRRQGRRMRRSWH